MSIKNKTYEDNRYIEILLLDARRTKHKNICHIVINNKLILITIVISYYSIII